MPGEPLRVMVVARLFSGLVESLDTGQWQPRGVPAIYKLLEALTDVPDIELIPVFAAKDADIGARFAHRRRVTVERLGGMVHILPYRHRPWLATVKLDGKLRELAHLARCLWLCWRFRPAVTYFTNANFVIAAIFARLGLGCTVLRFLGLHPEQKRLATNPGKWFDRLQRWLYASPFGHVVCTQEGSGAEYYLPKLLRPGTRTSILLNGVDMPAPAAEDVAALRTSHGLGQRPVVLFLGRLEWNKGCDDFVEAMIRVLTRRPGAADALVVGNGSRFESLSARIAEAGLDGAIRLVGEVPHSGVAAFLAVADIYVSLNRFGNLSNANLEALMAGKCMIIPEKDAANHVDEVTETLLPDDAVIRIARDDTVTALADALEALLEHPERIARYAARAHEVAERLLVSWGQRVRQELDIIRTASSKKAHPGDKAPSLYRDSPS